MKILNVLNNRNKEQSFAGQSFYRSTQRGAMEQLWNSQPQVFYRSDPNGGRKAGEYPLGFYHTNLVRNFY
ncbi:hypothetical protein [Faecalispora anaeroviscerum]|uniref:hypothetical protein n=1 Tax=Faecalispora anaeroviscerum TaxID=2991836 RepID=UPI0024BB4403|nr:hypothetical protein [Faecalispora anaeroviscerum]